MKQKKKKKKKKKETKKSWKDKIIRIWILNIKL